MLNRKADKLLVSVQKDIVEWEVVRGLTSDKEEVLVKSNSGPDSIAWFNHIRVSDEPWPSSVASVWVETHLQERSIAVAGDSHELSMTKSLDGPVLNVRLVPFAWREQAWVPNVDDPRVLGTARGIDIEYDLRRLTLTKKKDGEKASAEQKRSAAVAAMGILIYVVLFELALRAKASKQGLAMTLVRYDAHQKMYQEGATDVLRSLLPIYTFATLHVVGDEGRPQSGFCTYFFDAEHRLADFNLRETTRANILGTGDAAEKRRSLVSVLRAIHFLESEKPSDKNRLLPVLDPFDWVTPASSAAAGELEVVSRRGGRTILLSLPAILAHVTRVLHKEKVGDE